MRRIALLAALGLSLGSGTSRAQLVQLYVPDTALTILTNRTATAELRVSGGSGVSAYNITVFLDDSRLHFIAADTVPGGYGLNPPTITTGTEQVTLQASGPGTVFSTVILAKLTFRLDSLAQLGSLLSLRVNSLTDGLGANVLPGHRTGLLNVCQAEKIGGDVTGERVVNSRDALVVLTAAVGLPVSGFDLGRPADVDQDLRATSRDALFILSYGIGLPTSGAPLLGAWLTNNCAPLQPAPNDLVFWRSSNLYKIAAGDTVPTSLGVGGYDLYYARWSPDGLKLTFTAFISALSYEIMVVNGDGTGPDTLTGSTASDFAPDWSPDGLKIAFVSNRVSPQSIFTMNPDGTGQTQLTTTHTVYDVAWSPDGVRLAFTGYSVCCARRLWTVNADGSNVAEVFGGSDVHSPADPVWSPSGDSLIYYSQNRGRLYKVGATGDTVLASSLNGSQDSPWWANAVHTFRSFLRYPYDFFLRKFSDGRHLQLIRGVAGNDVRASVRRTLSAPLVYADTVTVTPDSILLLPDSVGTLTVVVKNNDGTPNTTAPVTWWSRDTTVAKVNNAGIVTATKNAGVTYVGATAGWRSDSTKVVVAVTLRAVSAGGYHACGLSADSLAYCWGYNAYGQLGTGTTVNSTHPMRVTGGLKLASITAGLYHTCGVTGAGVAYCWGWNGQGQLGNGNTTEQHVPTAVSGGLAFLSVEAGAQFTCGVTTANAGYCWGDNLNGQLGDSTVVDKSTPTPVHFGLPFANIAAATLHACGVTTAGTAVCWGYNLDGRLGDSTTVSRIYPDTVDGARTWASISAFDQHTCGVETTSGAAYCWGYNGWGQLGDSTFVNKIAPAAAKGLLLFASVSAGSLHTCGVTTGNAPYCWGYNGYGQLGDGTTTYRQVPVAVSGGLLMSAVSAGQDFSCGVATGTVNVVYCWGRNDFGQVGDGTITSRLVPVRVAGQN